MTIALDLAAPGQLVGYSEPTRRAGPATAPVDAIPLQASPSLVISLTEGCETPLEALKSAADPAVRCHPCDEAIVRLLLGRVRRDDGDLVVTPAIRPGTLSLG